MKRTELLQEVRKMRFEEAYEGCQRGQLTQQEAARLLGACDRTYRRYLVRYEEQVAREGSGLTIDFHDRYRFRLYLSALSVLIAVRFSVRK
ncbi:MAG: hypothetical protein C0402_14140 [Thermodesulfovibrio sp.]|nr:hypothetical protein [Thermodesulfovibrio sp.]